MNRYRVILSVTIDVDAENEDDAADEAFAYAEQYGVECDEAQVTLLEDEGD